ncbi:MAG: relaxase/mobilization nuclease domain-containing protein [Chloroflexota bacterium]|nr:relaxase/mobilization nuclease domain-containing protein [Chloroflexota bacterium]
MPGVYARFSAGRRGGSAANMRYITRPSATGRDEQSLLVRNYPDYAHEGGSYDEQRENLEAYARFQEDEELSQPKRGNGEQRTHYRMVLSFEEKVETDRAREMTDEYLDREFPDARAVAAVHQDTDHTHVHVHMQARDTEDHKLHFSRQDYEHLSDEWAEIYGHEFGRDRADDYFDKKDETREWRVEYAHALDDGREPPEAPERADRPDTPTETREREEHSYGLDETRAGGPERGPSDGDHEPSPGERALDDSAHEYDRAAEAADRTEHEADDTLRTAQDFADRLPEPQHERDREDRLEERGR